MRHKDPELMNRIKQYISEYYLENAGAMPTITEIAHAMEIVRSTAYTYLVSMDRQELIRYQDGKISVRELDKILVGSEQVDAVGEINCGEPALEEANLLYRTSLPTAIFGKGPFYILKAKGDSMVDAGIESGDTLIIRKNAEPKLGDIVVALDENNENTLKRYAGIDKESNKVVLEYMNQEVYPDKKILVSTLICQGVLSHVIKTM